MHFFAATSFASYDLLIDALQKKSVKMQDLSSVFEDD